mgnify:CR=1 FL=1
MENSTAAFNFGGSPEFVIMNEMAGFMYENALDSGFYSVNILWPLGPKVDSLKERLQQGDTRSLGSYEFAKHRQQWDTCCKKRRVGQRQRRASPRRCLCGFL